MNMRFLYHALYRIVWPFFSLAHPVRAQGRENIPEGGAVLCANHSALCDPILVCFACTLRWMVRPMAKIELSRVPVLGWLLGKAGVIYVDRGPRGCARGEGGPQVAEGGPEAADIPGGHPGP